MGRLLRQPGIHGLCKTICSGSLFDAFRAAVFQAAMGEVLVCFPVLKGKLHRIFLPLPVFCMEADGALKGIRARNGIFLCLGFPFPDSYAVDFHILYLGVFNRQRKIDLDIFAVPLRFLQNPKCAADTKPASGASPFFHGRNGSVKKREVFSLRPDQFQVHCPVLIFFPGLQDIFQEAAPEAHLSVHVNPVRCILLPQGFQLTVLKIPYIVPQYAKGLCPCIGVLSRHPLKNLLFNHKALSQSLGNILFQPAVNPADSPVKLPSPL